MISDFISGLVSSYCVLCYVWLIVYDVCSCTLFFLLFFFFFKQKTAYEMCISDWSSDVCSSDLIAARRYQPYSPAACGPCRRRHRSRSTDRRAIRCRRSEEHTSELQSLMRISYAVFCLKKNYI